MQSAVDSKSILPNFHWFCRKAALTVFVFSLTALAGCTKKNELGSQVVVQLPKSNLQASQDAASKRSHFDKIRKLEAMSELSWGLSRPTSLAETSCFAVVVEVPASERGSGLSGAIGSEPKTCTRSTGTDTIYVHQFAGLAAAGSQIEINMAPGSARKFHLFAFSADSTSECLLTDAGSLLTKSALSGPLLIGSATADIVSGSNNVEIVASYTNGLAYENCEWTEPPPLVGGAFQINAGATHTRLTTVNLTPSLPFVANQAYYTLDSTCRTGGTWEPYSPTKSGFSVSAGDGVKQVYARFRDSTGAVSSCLSSAIILDQTLPTVSIDTLPAANLFSAAAYPVSGSCSEEGRTVVISVGSVNATATCASGLFNIAGLDISSLADGILSMSAVLADVAGNSQTANRAVVKDTVVPTVAIVTPAPGSFMNASNQSSFNINGTCSDSGSPVDIFVEGSFHSSTTCLAGTFSTVLNLVPILDGPLTLMAQAVDNAGNTNSSSRAITKDTVPPVAQILSPTSAIHMMPSYVTSIGGVDVANYRWKNSSTAGDCYNATGYNGPFPIATPINQSTVTPQTHAICVLGIDAAGNEQSVASPTVEDFTRGPVLLSFNQRISTAADSVGLRYLDVSISPPLTNPETLFFEVQGSAISGNHYTGFLNGLGSMALPTLTSTMQIPVSVIGSSISLEEKRLSVSLTGASNGAIRVGAVGTHQMWIESSSSPFYGLTRIAIGTRSGCGINAAGKLYCWGSDSNGQVGDGAGVSNQSLPIQIDAGFSYLEVAVGNSYACGIRTTGDVTCWGENSAGQLGDNTTTARYSPTVIDGGTTYSKIATYMSTTCGITTSGDLKCWGAQEYGQVGNNQSTGFQTTPVVISGGTLYVDLAMGWDHGCAVRASGEVDCWGRNDAGQIGDGTPNNALTPTPVLTLTGIQRIYAGQKYSCALNSLGEAFCWGEGASGKLGNGSSSGSSVPIPAQSGSTFSSLSLSSGTTCGIDAASGDARCWGYGYYGLLGTGGGGGGSFTPVTTLLPSPVSTLAGNGTSMCAIALGRAYCWGNAQNAHLGTGIEGRRAWDALPVERNFGSMSLGRGGCGIRIADGALSCWGPNDLDNVSSVGQIGDGSSTRRHAPVFIDRPTGYFKVSVGTQHTCAITQTNDLRCWGYNNAGQLGIGNTTNQFLPMQVDTGYQQVSVGTGFTCGVRSGAVNCWGKNDVGQLGIGSFGGNQNLPTPTTLINALQVSAGANHACAILSGGLLYCWGKNDFGQLGLGDSLNRESPTQVPGNWMEVSAGANVTCAINSSFSLYCWGRNDDAEIGQGATSPTPFNTPTYISGSYNKVIVGSSTKGNAPGTHVCALSGTGQLYCWGSNRLGQNHYASAPVYVLSPTLVDGEVYTDFAVGETQTCGKRPSGAWFCRGFTQENHLPLGAGPDFPHLLPRLNY